MEAGTAEAASGLPVSIAMTYDANNHFLTYNGQYGVSTARA